MPRLTFLIADDDDDDAQLVCEALSKIDPEVICYCVNHGEEMFRLLDSKELVPQVILLDINMPVMDGWRCLTDLKGRGKYQDIPVLMYSTSTLTADIRRALSMGANGFVTKPSNFKQIQKLLADIYTKLLNNEAGNLCEVEGVVC